jgi:hypothetical protein
LPHRSWCLLCPRAIALRPCHRRRLWAVEGTVVGASVSSHAALLNPISWFSVWFKDESSIKIVVLGLYFVLLSLIIFFNSIILIFNDKRNKTK